MPPFTHSIKKKACHRKTILCAVPAIFGGHLSVYEAIKMLFPHLSTGCTHKSALSWIVKIFLVPVWSKSINWLYRKNYFIRQKLTAGRLVPCDRKKDRDEYQNNLWNCFGFPPLKILTVETQEYQREFSMRAKHLWITLFAKIFKAVQTVTEATIAVITTSQYPMRSRL